MAGNIMLEVVTPDQSVVSEEAQIVVAPGEYGEFGILIGHTSFLTTLACTMDYVRSFTGSSRLPIEIPGRVRSLPLSLLHFIYASF